MNATELELLEDLVKAVEADIIQSMKDAGRFATGQTIEAMEIVQVGDEVQLLAPDYIDILERGRGPTSPDAERADPPLIDRIKAWCAAKGIEESAAYPILKKIHEKGYAGKPGVISVPLNDDNIDKLATDVADRLASLLITSTLKL